MTSKSFRSTLTNVSFKKWITIFLSSSIPIIYPTLFLSLHSFPSPLFTCVQGKMLLLWKTYFPSRRRRKKEDEKFASWGMKNVRHEMWGEKRVEKKRLYNFCTYVPPINLIVLYSVPEFVRNSFRPPGDSLSKPPFSWNSFHEHNLGSSTFIHPYISHSSRQILENAEEIVGAALPTLIRHRLDGKNNCSRLIMHLLPNVFRDLWPIRRKESLLKLVELKIIYCHFQVATCDFFCLKLFFNWKH